MDPNNAHIAPPTIATEKKYIVLVTFSGYGKILNKVFREDELWPTYRYKMRVRKICNVAVIHSIEWFEAKMINKKAFEPISTIKIFQDINTETTTAE